MSLLLLSFVLLLFLQRYEAPELLGNFVNFSLIFFNHVCLGLDVVVEAVVAIERTIFHCIVVVVYKPDEIFVLFRFEEFFGPSIAAWPL